MIFQKQTKALSGLMLITLFCILAFPADSRAFTFLVSNWVDAEKTSVQDDDDSMCWAASAANVLVYTGWSDIYSQDADTVFDYYQEHWANEGGSMVYAWEWWLNGEQRHWGKETNGALTVSGGGDFYPGYRFMDYFYSDTDTTTVMASAALYLTSEYGTSLGIWGYDSSLDREWGHALTIWGYDLDDSGSYTGIWVTDSDDYQAALVYYALSFSDGQYWLLDYGMETTSWYLFGVYALDQMPVPLAGSGLMLGMGLLVLVGRLRTGTGRPATAADAPGPPPQRP